ncbi:MAG: hypothetical protein AB7Q17_06795 [Phycisphaerae bacterium]
MWKLNTESAGERRSPKESDIDAALVEARRAGGFVILSRAPEDYMQTDGRMVEVRRDGRHLRLETEHEQPVDGETLRNLFASFFRDHEEWRHASWRDVGDELNTTHRPGAASGRAAVGTLAAIALVGSAALIWWLTR